jgi:hypothetical protein
LHLFSTGRGAKLRSMCGSGQVQFFLKNVRQPVLVGRAQLRSICDNEAGMNLL